MTHENEIDKKINDEYELIRNAPYAGAIPPPENLINLFKKALMEIPFAEHNMNMVKVREILEKSSIAEITMMEIGIINNFIQKVPPKYLFGSAYKYCEFMIANHAFTTEYNKEIAEIEKKLQAKKAVMKNTSGIIKGNPGRIVGLNGK